MSTKILVLFQDTIDVDKEPDWMLSFSVGNQFEMHSIPEEPLHTHYVLPLDQYQKILSMVSIMSYETYTSRTYRMPFYNVKQLHLDSVLDSIREWNKT